MILILDQRSDRQPIAPQLLTPEPRLRKCSKRTCLKRLGVYLPDSERRGAAGVGTRTQRAANRRLP